MLAPHSLTLFSTYTILLIEIHIDLTKFIYII